MKIPAGSQFKLGTLLVLFLAATLSAAHGQNFTLRKVSPPTSTYSFAAGINQKGTTVVGAFQDAGSQFKGFAYNGIRYQTIEVPGPGATQAAGVNDSNTVVGFFDGNDGFTHGFLINNGRLTQYDVNKGVVSTYIYGINNAGNFTGFVGFNGANQGFVNIGGTVTQFTVNGNPTIAIAIDSSNNTVGSFGDPNFVNTHGFYRDAAGVITQIDYPGAGVTGCQGINDLGEITGFYVDSLGVQHGFVTKNGKFRTVPLPAIAGVNNHRSFVGYYIGTNGVTYGYLASPR
jgi:hypothetical protein